MGQLGHELAHLELREPAELQAPQRPLAAQVADQLVQRVAVGDLALAVGAEEQHPARRGRAHEMPQQLERRPVRPLQVVEHEHHRRLRADLAQQRGHGVEEAEALRVRLRAAHVPAPAGGGMVGGRGPELRQQDRELRRARAQPVAQGVQRRARRPPAQHLDHRLVERQGLLVEAPVEHRRAVRVRAGGHLGHEPRLADPGVARQQHQRALSLGGLTPAALQEGELDPAPDQRVAIHRGGQRRRPRRGLQGHRQGGHGGRSAVRGRRLAAEHALEHGHRRLPGRRAQLLAQQRAQLLERAQRLGRVARGLVDLHQQAMGGLAEGRGGDRGACGLFGRAQLAPALAQPGLGQRLQSAQAQRVQLPPLLGRPAALGVGQERLQVGEQRVAGPDGRQDVVAGLHRGLGGEDRGARGLDVHDDGALKLQAQLAAPGQHAFAQRAAQLRQQRAQRGVGRGGRALGPQRVDELVARAAATAIEHEVGEQQAPLAPREPCVQSMPVRLDQHGPAQADVPAFVHLLRRQATGSPRFLQGLLNRRSASFRLRPTD